MAKAMYVDGHYCPSMEAAAARIGCHKTTLTRVMRMHNMRYRGHDIRFASPDVVPQGLICPCCGEAIELLVRRPR